MNMVMDGDNRQQLSSDARKNSDVVAIKLTLAAVPQQPSKDQSAPEQSINAMEAEGGEEDEDLEIDDED